MKKLILNEDDNINTSVESIDVVSKGNLLSTLIKSGWDAIEMYNSILLTFQNEGNEELVKIISDIVSEEYIHIGQLEKALQLINNTAEVIEDGKEETAELMSDNS